jgi:hypothetical protein
MITEENIIRIAMLRYDNIQCNSIEEFQQDYNRVQCVKKLINKHIRGYEMNIRLILNHIIILHNAFDTLSIDMLFFALRDSTQHMEIVKAFLVYLKYIESDTWNDIDIDGETFSILLNL